MVYAYLLLVGHITVSVARDEQFEFAVRPLFGVTQPWCFSGYLSELHLPNVISGALE